MLSPAVYMWRGVSICGFCVLVCTSVYLGLYATKNCLGVIRRFSEVLIFRIDMHRYPCNFAKYA